MLAFVELSAFSQTLYVPNGTPTGIGSTTSGNNNIGIGNGNTNPAGLLHLRTPSNGNSWSSYNYGANLVIDGPHHNSIGLLDAGSGNPFAITNISGTLTFSKMPALGDISTAPIYLMSVVNSGNVGIGTIAPSTKLQVYGGAFQQVNSDLNSGIYLDATATSEPKVGWRVSDNSERFRIHFKGVNTTSERLAFFKTIGSEAEVFSVFANGNVGIGTTTVPEKLNVNGKIKCEEVQVVVDVPADYVFETKYKLPSITELDHYIQQNKHLPGIPNAETLKTNGWNVGEMNNKLLEKIEELTLYMIELKRENEKLKQRVNNIERTK